ncbi:MAG: hypothetical protein FWJ65_06815 [Limnochordales bacterium]
MSQEARPWRMFRSDGQQGGFGYELVAEFPSLTPEQAKKAAEVELMSFSGARSVIMVPADAAIEVSRKDLQAN